MRELLHLRMTLESFTTATLEICCVWCVTKDVGLACVRPYLVRSYAPCPLDLLASVYSSRIDGGAILPRASTRMSATVFFLVRASA